jgi:hypothetical protein
MMMSHMFHTLATFMAETTWNPLSTKLYPTASLDMKTANKITRPCQDLNLTHAVTGFND